MKPHHDPSVASTFECTPLRLLSAASSLSTTLSNFVDAVLQNSRLSTSESYFDTVTL